MINVFLILSERLNGLIGWLKKKTTLETHASPNPNRGIQTTKLLLVCLIPKSVFHVYPFKFLFEYFLYVEPF